MIELLSNPEAWIGFLTLLLLEVVLGIDNIVFISILAGKLPPDQRARARSVGLSLAMITRILFLLGIGVIVGLTAPFASILGADISGRALILILGGAFLIFKATMEIHHKLEGEERPQNVTVNVAFGAVIGQILLIDLVFSLDSVITAVGMVKWIEVMIAAVVVSVGFMLWFAGSVSRFIDQHPSLKILALAFLILIGANLVAEGLGHHIPKGYTYFAMAFSLAVEVVNIRVRSKKPVEPVHLRSAIVPGDTVKEG